MSLKFKVKSKDEVPPDDQRHYVERDGAWVLEVDGGVDKARLDEMRANNLGLLKELNDFKTRYEGVDPASVRTLLAEKARLQEAQQLKAGEIEKVVEGRLKAARTEWEKQFSAVSLDRDSMKAALEKIQIDQAVVAEATKRGLRATAIEDLTARARRVFVLVDGVPRAMEADGRTARIGKDGLTPLAVPDWVETLVTDAPHLFERNVGGGAAGDGSGGAGNRSGRNPFRKETWNLTEQMRLTKTDPQLAQRLKAAA